MNTNEALKIIGVDSISESEEALENKIFEIKQEIFANSHVPQLILAKQKKLKQLVTICKTLNFKLVTEIDKFEIELLNSESILDSFNLYHKNRAQILQKMASNSELNFLISCCDLLVQNLKNWAKKWPKLETDGKNEVKLSKELESVEMLRLIKEVCGCNIFNFNDLNHENTPKYLMFEIQRLNELTTFFEKE
jgi:hypothetical protein